jgi:hypothetical protein
VIDAGARLLAAFGSIIADGSEADIERAQATLVDPVGRAYRFGLARSLLHGARGARTVAAGQAPAAEPEPAVAAHATGESPAVGAVR